MNVRTPALWLSTTRREAVLLTKRLWPELSLDQKSGLLRAIIQGPPRHLYRSDITDEQWEEVRDREAWTWLNILKRSALDHTLPSEGEEEFARLRARHSDWQLPDWQAEGFVSWSYGAGFVGQPTEISAQELLGKSPEDIITLEMGGKLGASREVWRQAAGQNSKLAASVLCGLAERETYPENIWTGVLQALPQFDSGSLIAVLKVLTQAPDALVAEILSQVSMWLSIRGSDLDPEAEKFLWPVWDRLRLLAEKREVTSVGANAINAAINHPFGNLAEVLIKRFWAAKPEPNQGLGTLSSRFTAITSASGDGAWCGRVILGTALNPLFVVDPTWTKENLIPHFNWEKAEDAPLLWDGYLSSPRLTVSLLAQLKPQLLEAFRQIERLDNWASLCALLAAIGLEGAGEVTAEEVREPIRAMGAKGRHELTAWIVRRMRPPGPADSSQTEPGSLATERKTRARFFAERAIPWLMSVWPPEEDTVDDTVSANVAIASIWAGDAYPRAVKELRFFWKKTKDPDMLLRDLRESKQAENFPTETLELLYLLIGDPLHLFAATELQAVLHGLSLANPKLTDDPRYASLRDAAISASA